MGDMLKDTGDRSSQQNALSCENEINEHDYDYAL